MEGKESQGFNLGMFASKEPYQSVITLSRPVCVLVQYSHTSLSRMTTIQRICPGQRVIRDNRLSFSVKIFEFIAFHTEQRGSHIIEFRDSEV